jgi:hypothetical protein
MSSEAVGGNDNDDTPKQPILSLPEHEEAASTSYDLDSTIASTLPSGATTPAQPDLTFPSKVQEVIQSKSSGAASDAVIIGIAVVDFNHLVGPQVEYAHPKELLEDEELCGKLPFLALPDGSHLVRTPSCPM